jgi:hypothetical protein
MVKISVKNVTEQSISTQRTLSVFTLRGNNSAFIQIQAPLAIHTWPFSPLL